MTHLRIQVLGPLCLWDADDDGLWHVLNYSRGNGSAALLAAMIFHPGPMSWKGRAEQLWDQEAVDRDPERYELRLKTAASRLRTQLGPHRNVLPERRPPSLEGRKPHGDKPQLVRIDWDDLHQYQQHGEHEKALSLVLCDPLPELDDNDIRIGPLLGEVREMVRAKVRVSLKALKLPIPEPLILGRHLPSDFEASRPVEWQPGVAASTAPALSLRATSRPTTGLQRLRQRRPPHHLGPFRADELFERCHEGEARLARELDQAATDEAETWWSEGSNEWLGNYFAYWFKTLTTPCEQIGIVYDGDRHDSARFDVTPAVDAPNDKATLVEASTMFGDNPEKQITCSKTNWGFAYVWAKDHAECILGHSSNPSVFGVCDRPVYPGIAAVHTLVQSRDGYVLFALRGPKVDFYRLTWSTSFEEGLSVGAREFTGPMTGDGTLLHVIQGGLYEEWGIEEEAIADSTCLAIGREWVREPQGQGSRLNISPTVLAACRLNLSLEEVWTSLDASGGIRDRDEHRSWAGCRFEQRDEVLRFVSAARGRTEDLDLQSICDQPDIRAELQLYPGNGADHVRDRGLMPTSAARLVLASAWLDTLDPLETYRSAAEEAPGESRLD